MWALMDRNLSHVLLSEQMRIRERMSKLPILGQYFHPVRTQENPLAHSNRVHGGKKAKNTVCNPWHFSKLQLVAIVYTQIKISQENYRMQGYVSWAPKLLELSSCSDFCAQRCMNPCPFNHPLSSPSFCPATYHRHTQRANIFTRSLFMSNERENEISKLCWIFIYFCKHILLT